MSEQSKVVHILLQDQKGFEFFADMPDIESFIAQAKSPAFEWVTLRASWNNSVTIKRDKIVMIYTSNRIQVS